MIGHASVAASAGFLVLRCILALLLVLALVMDVSLSQQLTWSLVIVAAVLLV